MERWKPAPGLRGFYEVSNIGRVRRAVAIGKNRRNAKIGKIRKLQPDKNGYLTVLACLGSRKDVKLAKVHRLVVGAFIGEIPEGMQVNHKNGVKYDNRVENLEIVTPSQNTQHAFDVLGRKVRITNPPKGEAHHHSRFTESNIREMRSLYASGITQVEIAERFQTRQNKISEIVLRKAWKHVYP